METMHASGRRKLPPVPRPADAVADPAVRGESSDESPAERTMELRRRAPEETPAVTSADDDTASFEPATDPRDDVTVDPELLAAADEPELALEDDDPAQDFVSRLRAAAAEFAAAAGAETAVVREAVPPARHRRSRCRVVLRYPDGGEADLTFLGRRRSPRHPGLAGLRRADPALAGHRSAAPVRLAGEDTEAPDGVAVDVPAWVAAG